MADVAWRGIFKLQEELGELGQVLGKLGPFPSGDHPDGGPPLRQRLEDEIADVAAAISYFAHHGGLDADRMADRCDRKLALFEKWGLTGIPDADQVDGPT